MKQSASAKDWLPLAKGRRKARQRNCRRGEAKFPHGWIDFGAWDSRGQYRTHERITQILKFHLEQWYRKLRLLSWTAGDAACTGGGFIGCPRANREAKPISNKVRLQFAPNFSYLGGHRKKTFKSGLQVKARLCARPRNPIPVVCLKPDWDWHRLIKQCAAGTETRCRTAPSGEAAKVLW